MTLPPDVVKAVTVDVEGLRIVSEQNVREHWTTKARRARLQKELVTVALVQVDSEVRNALRASPRIVVRFTRFGGKRMDTDNLTGGFKHVRDQVAKWLGRDDSPDSGISWAEPSQVPSRKPGVRITLEAT